MVPINANFSYYEPWTDFCYVYIHMLRLSLLTWWYLEIGPLGGNRFPWGQLGHKEQSQPPMIGLASFIINTKKFVSSPSLTLPVRSQRTTHVRMQQKGVICNLRRELFSNVDPAGTLILHLQSPAVWKNKFSCSNHQLSQKKWCFLGCRWFTSCWILTWP